MKIKTVTITGADDNTNHQDLIEISKKYPFVEWGILFSTKRIGTDRYPSAEWLDKLYLKTKELNNLDVIRCSAHLCGDYSSDIISTGDESFKYGDVVEKYTWLFDRCQLNFNSTKTPVDYSSLFNFVMNWANQTILQYNKSNEFICEKIISDFIETDDIYLNDKLNFLYDGSGGRGVLPTNWRGVIPNHFTGYAGGLNPDNLEDALINIEKSVGDNEIWIDTETGVRTDDKLDLDKVVRFLEIAKKYI